MANKYEDNGVNAGGLLDPDIKWNALLVAFLTLKPSYIDEISEEKLAELNASLMAAFGVVTDNKSYAKKKAIDIVETICSGRFERAFTTFIFNIGANLPTLAEIEADPENVRVPDEAHFQYVIASAIVKTADEHKVAAFTKYLARLFPDIAIMAAHDIEQSKPDIMTPELKALQK